MFHHHLLPLTLHRHILAHHCIWTEIQYKTHNKTNGHLTHYLVFTFQSLLVATEYLDIVVEEPKESKPYRCHYHEYQIDIAHTAKQQHRQEYCHHYDNTSHSGHSLFLDTKRVDTCVALHLGYVATFHVLDKLLAKPCRDNQRKDKRQKRSERYICPYVSTGNIILVEKSKQII